MRVRVGTNLKQVGARAVYLGRVPVALPNGEYRRFHTVGVWGRGGIRRLQLFDGIPKILEVWDKT